MKAQIKREFTLILIGSLLMALFLSVMWHFPLRLMIVSAMLINFSLILCTWYSERINRPILFQVMVIFYIGITAYCMLSINETSMFGKYYDGYLLARIGSLFAISVILICLISWKALESVIKTRVDAWIPPLWPVVFAGAAAYIANKTIETETLRMYVLITTGGLVAATAYKNNRMQNRSVAYEVSNRHYLRYLIIFAFVAFEINNLIPKTTALPGTNLLKKLTNNWGKGIAGQIDSEIKLNRNPSQSEDLVLRVKSDGAVYLRSMAYSTYEKGEWKIANNDRKLKPLDTSLLNPEYELIQYGIEEMKKGHIAVPEGFQNVDLSLPETEVKHKQAYIEEIEDFDYYFSLNGFKEIKAADAEKIGYYQDINNIYFASMNGSNDISYTIDYDQYKLEPDSREYAIFNQMTIDLYDEIVYELSTSGQEKPDKIQKMLDRDNDYYTIIKKYMQLPQEIQSDILGITLPVTRNYTGDWQKAQAICDYLKKSGTYTYELGAPYVNKKNDPVVDFLMYGHKGICQDFASSMTLMCRSIGIPARYVTGYHSIDRTQNDASRYDVRIKDAHAFVEAYIIGYGWMLFDPTPASMSQDGIGEKVIEQAAVNNTGGIDIGDPRILIFILLVVGIILFVIYPLNWIRSAVWKWYVLKTPPKRSIQLLMKQTLKILEEKSTFLKNEETVSMLAKRLRDKGVDITPVTKPFEAFYYGGKEPDAAQMNAAMACYNELKRKQTQRKLVDPDGSTGN